MSDDFKSKRIEYINNWPNSELFEIEKLYDKKVKSFKLVNGTIFDPFKLKTNDDMIYNKSISFVIDAFEQIEKHPNFSYEFIFKALDCFIEHFYPSRNITYSCKMLCDNEWTSIIVSNNRLLQACKKMFSSIPVKACQYFYIRLADKNAMYKRLTHGPSGEITPDSTKRKQLIDDIELKYGRDYADYANSIRKASMLCRYVLKNDSVSIDATNYYITIEDKLHFLVAGFLYAFRNDMMHGSNISITKSSKTTLGTYALNYYAFLLLYYLLIMLFLNKFSEDYPTSAYDELAENIERNLELYQNFFGKEIEK